MNISPTHSAYIINGKIKFFDQDLLNKHLEKLDGRKVKIKITRFKKSRTDPQNRLYWMRLNHYGDELGYDPEEMHDTFKAMFLTDETEKLPIVRSTTKLSTQEFTDYMNKIDRKMAKMGVPPLPFEDFTLDE